MNSSKSQQSPGFFLVLILAIGLIAAYLFYEKHHDCEKQLIVAKRNLENAYDSRAENLSAVQRAKNNWRIRILDNERYYDDLASAEKNLQRSVVKIEQLKGLILKLEEFCGDE